MDVDPYFPNDLRRRMLLDDGGVEGGDGGGSYVCRYEGQPDPGPPPPLAIIHRPTHGPSIEDGGGGGWTPAKQLEGPPPLELAASMDAFHRQQHLGHRQLHQLQQQPSPPTAEAAWDQKVGVMMDRLMMSAAAADHYDRRSSVVAARSSVNQYDDVVWTSLPANNADAGFRLSSEEDYRISGGRSDDYGSAGSISSPASTHHHQQQQHHHHQLQQQQQSPASSEHNNNTTASQSVPFYQWMSVVGRCR